MMFWVLYVMVCMQGGCPVLKPIAYPSYVECFQAGLETGLKFKCKMESGR